MDSARGKPSGREEKSGEGRTLDGRSPSQGPDVYLNVPLVKVEEISITVENLEARVSLTAAVLDLLKLNVGADAFLGKVELGMKGVEAQALLEVRLDNVANIVDRVLTTLDRNPEILQHIGRGVEPAARGIGQGTGKAVGEIGEGAEEAVGDVGRGVGGAVEDVGRGAGDAVEDVGKSAGDSIGDVGKGAGNAAEDVGETAKGAGEAVGGGEGESESGQVADRESGDATALQSAFRDTQKSMRELRRAFARRTAKRVSSR